jgi:signal peptidase I
LRRLPEIPSWFYLAAVAVGAVVGIVFLLARNKITVQVDLNDSAMRPAIGKATSFTVDPSWLAKPKRNAIVAFVVPGGSAGPVVARAVALRGDTLEVRSGKLYVNGVLNAKATRALPEENVAKLTCPRDCIYVLVDAARAGNQDSTDFGPLPLWRVLGSISP